MSLRGFQANAAYRRFDSELLAVHLESGRFFYFTSNTQVFFDFFQTPRSLEVFFDAAGISADSEEREYVETFVRGLIDAKLFRETRVSETSDLKAFAYSRPAMIRQGESTVNEVAFLWNISGPHTSDTGT